MIISKIPFETITILSHDVLSSYMNILFSIKLREDSLFLLHDHVGPPIMLSFESTIVTKFWAHNQSTMF